MGINVTYYGKSKPAPGVKPVVPALPFNKKNPPDWMTGKSQVQLKKPPKDVEVAWARLTGLRDENDAIMADIFRGIYDPENVIEQSAAIRVLNEPDPVGEVLWTPTEGLIFVVVFHDGQWEGAFADGETIDWTSIFGYDREKYQVLMHIPADEGEQPQLEWRNAGCE